MRKIFYKLFIFLNFFQTPKENFWKIFAAKSFKNQFFRFRRRILEAA